LEFPRGKKDGTDIMAASSARVLIVEDNDALRAMLFTILRHQPLAVDTAVAKYEPRLDLRGPVFPLTGLVTSAL
jgi:hypothetical protein